MPHITVEYTDNIQNEINIKPLLQKMNQSLISEGDVFSPQAIRARAIKLTDYITAHESTDDAFVHVTVKIAPGRSEQIKKTAFEHLFEVLQSHVKGTVSGHPVAYSIDFGELCKAGDTYKQGNI